MRTLLLHLYPGAWRRRYGEEFGALLKVMPLTPQTVVDVAFAALRDRVLSLLRPARSHSVTRVRA